MEWLEHAGPAWFVTLTYDEKHVPEGKSLEKKKFLQWLKDVQKRHSGPFRYYAVGEYGDRTKRPHYHMAVFFEHPAQYHALKAGWKKGFTQFGEINTARSRYLANYTAKKLTKPDDPRLADREPEFRTSSRNPPLGSAFVERTGNSRQAKKFVELTGDAPRSFRFDGRIYPFGDWALKKLRECLGVPLTEAERAAQHEEYYLWYPPAEAENDPEKARVIREHIDAKKRQGHWRGKGSKI